MEPENPVSPAPRVLLPALVCAGVCIILMRTGFLSLFFLVPLGFCALGYGQVAAWLCFVFTALGNSVFTVGAALYQGAGFAHIGLDILYFALLSLGFTWIMADNPPENNWIPSIPRIRTLFRFVAASVVATLVFLGVVFALTRDGGFSDLIHSQIEAISAGVIASSGVDAARQSVLERSFTADRIIEVMVAFALRGGALISAFVLFFFSRQAAFIVARIFRRSHSRPGDLLGFHVPRKAVWVLSLCLLTILAGRVFSISFIEIAAWNLLVICVMMFLAQGGGIVLFTLTHRPIPGIMRLLLTVAIVFLAFSPGINVLVLGGLVLLGIAENWLPMRTLKKDIPAA